MFVLLFGTSGALLAGGIVASLKWRLMHDTPILLYLGFLMDRFHAVPYRDFFDMNLPGTYLFFALAGHLLGYGDFAFRCLDVACLIGILLLALLALQPLGRRVPLLGGALFGLQYLSLGPVHSLQREYLMLLPLAAALLVLSPRTRWSPRTKAACTGVLFGLAATIKPAFLIGGPIALLWLAWDSGALAPGRGAPGALSIVGAGLASMLVPLALVAIWLVKNGALGPFLEMARSYWPLYARLGPLHQTVGDSERTSLLLWGSWALGGRRSWLIPATLGLWLALARGDDPAATRRYATLLGALAMAYAVYPALAGQFWPYHWLPLMFLIDMLASMCVIEHPGRAAPWLRIAAPLVLAAVMFAKGLPPQSLYDPLQGKPIPAPLRGRVDAIADYLRTHLKPGDTVQPLDWTGGAVHAMLLARARLATPFAYDFHFYHHVSQPYVQTLRRRFIADLTRARPRFVIWVESDKPWVSGPGTTREFPELIAFLADHYRIDRPGDGYVILRRVD